MTLGLYDEADTDDLPHPEIPLALHLIVEAALRAAWDRLRTTSRPGFDLGTATEDIVTHELYEILYDEVYDCGVVDGFDRELFKVVAREAKLRNFNRAKLDKMPDLLVGLVDRPRVKMPSQDWLFIECKPVDGTHTIGVHYCDKGVVRFIDGDYAWAMRSALMVGYARAGYTIAPKLIETLTSGTARVPATQAPIACPRSPATAVSDAVFQSDHLRRFDYNEPPRPAPAIRLRHLWLRRD